MKAQWKTSLFMVAAVLAFSVTNVNCVYHNPITLFRGVLGNNSLELEGLGLAQATPNTTYTATFVVSRYLATHVQVNVLNVSLFTPFRAEYQIIMENQDLTFVYRIEKNVTLTVPPTTGLIPKCFIYVNFTADGRSYDEHLEFSLPLHVDKTYDELNSEWSDEYVALLSNYTSLEEQMAPLNEELRQVRNLMYVSIVIAGVFIAITGYLLVKKTK